MNGNRIEQNGQVRDAYEKAHEVLAEVRTVIKGKDDCVEKAFCAILAFCVAMVINGRGTGWLSPSTVTQFSSMTSNSADWVLGEVRLISSARKRLHMMGPG